MDDSHAGAETKQTSTKLTTYPKSAKNISSIKERRCNVCGYLCARELPPSICPIYKAKVDCFEQFIFRKMM